MKFICLLLTITSLLSCSSKKIEIGGFYADEFFDTRHLGHQWVAVSIEEQSDTTILVNLFSSKNQKAPGCKLTVQANYIQPEVYTATKKNIPLEFIFSDDGLSITSTTIAQRDKLSQFCSGSYSIESFYKRRLTKELETIHQYR